MTEQYSDIVQKGRVIDQSVAAEERISVKTEIEITISLGSLSTETAVLTVPDLTGMTKKEAIKALEKLKEETGFTYTLGEEKKEYSQEVKKGRIISQSLEPGTKVRTNEVINLVISQSLEADAKAAKGSVVTIAVSLGKALQNQKSEGGSRQPDQPQQPREPQQSQEPQQPQEPQQSQEPYNEDCAGAEHKGGMFCFVLADGLRGHGGDEASRLVTEYILGDFKKNGEVSGEYLEKCFEGSQCRLLAEQKRQGRELEMKTTLVILLADERFLLWGHIGDSRLYYFQDRKLVQRTLDHSVPQMLVAAGEIREREIRHHPDRNRLLRVMGMEWEMPRYQIAQPMARSGKEEILLCSDGFWEWI